MASAAGRDEVDRSKGTTSCCPDSDGRPRARMPSFLDKLYREEEARKRDKAAAAPHTNARRTASASTSSESDAGDVSIVPSSALSSASSASAGTSRTPGLYYYSSSTTSTSSSEPPFETSRDRSGLKESLVRHHDSFTLDELSGYSSEESRNTSPNSKSAFSSPAFALNSFNSPSLAFCGSFLSHHGHLGPLKLPPATLELDSATPSPPSTLPSRRSDITLNVAGLASGYASSAITASTDEELISPPLTGKDDDTLVQPPDNFAMVYPGLYRSSFPKPKNFSFLKGLNLKTVLTLVPDEYPQENLDFFKANGIQFFQIGLPGNKEPFVSIPDDKVRKALAIVLDKRNHPMLIHCNKGKHRTGCLVGCLRKMQCWSSTAIFDEYRKFSFPKSRAMDQLFIELFQPDWAIVDKANLPEWCLGEDGGGSPGVLSPVEPKR